MSINIRAHHGMCLAFFEGKGYSKGFTLHMQKVLDYMQKKTVVTIITEEDIICSACPHFKGTACETSEKVKNYDNQVLKYCEIKSGETLRWDDFQALVKEKIIYTHKRMEICKNCQWSEICNKKEENKFK